MSDYDADFYQRAQTQAAALRAKDWAALDVANLAEEIERVGIADVHASTRHLQRLLLYVLKWRDQPTHRTPSRRCSIRQARDAITDRLEPRPSLRDYPARRLPLTTFPETCPWPVAQVLEADFWPEGQS